MLGGKGNSGICRCEKIGKGAFFDTCISGGIFKRLDNN